MYIYNSISKIQHVRKLIHAGCSTCLLPYVVCHFRISGNCSRGQALVHVVVHGLNILEIALRSGTHLIGNTMTNQWIWIFMSVPVVHSSYRCCRSLFSSSFSMQSCIGRAWCFEFVGVAFEAAEGQAAVVNDGLRRNLQPQLNHF